MEKVLFIVFARGDQQPASLMTTDEIIGRSTQLSVERYPDVSLQVEEREITDQWQRRDPGAYRMHSVLSVWTECADDVRDVEQVVSAISSDYAGFVVTEAMPKGRAAGFVSSVDAQPGIKVTSLLCRASSLTRDEFLSHWYEVHMPMSLRIHPQWTYARNVISRTLTPGAPDGDAVCEEGFEHLNDVLDPERFYGADDGQTWVQNRATIGDDVVKFLDRSQSLTSIMREYRLRNFRR